MKYEAQGNDIRKALQSAKQVLILLSASADVDTVAAGLSLYLSLSQAQKEVQIATEAQMLVSHTNLYGVGEVKKDIPVAGGGNLVITLGGVAENGTAPALQRLDYSTSGNDLNLIFHVLPGKDFKPTFITPRSEGNYDLVFVLGSKDLGGLGSLHSSNPALFAQTTVVNIDKNESNSLYGQVNLVDSQSSSVSEIVATILFDLQLPVDGDISTNIVSGLYAATNNLQNGALGADTFMVIAESMKRGGKKPGETNIAQVIPSQASPAVSEPDAVPASDLFNQFLAAPAALAPQPTGGSSPEKQPEYQPSPEEAVMGEGLGGGEQVTNPEPDWLTPKVYKSGNIG